MGLFSVNTNRGDRNEHESGRNAASGVRHTSSAGSTGSSAGSMGNSGVGRSTGAGTAGSAGFSGTNGRYAGSAGSSGSAGTAVSGVAGANSEANVNALRAIKAAKENKIMLNDINARIDELQEQNIENAKLLKSMVSKIEDEISVISRVNENRSIEIYDDADLRESISRLEKSLDEINNNDVLDAISNINSSIDEINNQRVMEEIDKVKGLINANNADKADNERMVSEINAKLQKMETKDYSGNLEELKTDISGVKENLNEVYAQITRVSTMPTTLKAMMELKNRESIQKEELLHGDTVSKLKNEMGTYKHVIKINMWINLVTLMFIVLRILGVL